MKTKVKTGSFLWAERFARLTTEMMLRGQIQRVKKCLTRADSIFLTGNESAKNAVVNVYLYTVSSLLQLHHVPIESLLPAALRKEYIKQINAF